MTNAYWAVSDALTMTGRGLRHLTRSIDSLLTSIILPVLLMLVFVYIFGGAIAGRDAYVNYVVPGIILLCCAYSSTATAVGVTNDMVTGVIDRFRSLPIRGSTVLTGHVAASLFRNAIATVLVLGVAVIAGFRPNATAAEWLAAVAFMLLFVLAMSWLAVCAGLLARNADAAGGFTFIALFLPYLSSAFVPTSTMPKALHAIADHQPITPMIETLRGLLRGAPIGNSAWLAIAWFGGILLVSYVGAGLLFKRRTA
ncbi:transport permease protein [Virgisporangium aliadipatigenens]|uniref:Transport permease protein n=1 Tax=Virgisporangium aliadipatigenens TaxID=741659 RepID=A0A8J3YSR1_9ACTN|nr:ABC transporter permease [Virgisporangium aliadipatigenens]GIJ51169.1 transport permease protein [Virgisporangium aliadipatigenens]